MPEPRWSPAAQAVRRAALYRLHRELLPRVFDPEGGLQPGANPENRDDARVAAWHCFAAFAGETDAVHLANGLLRSFEFLPGYDFFMCALVQLYVRHRQQLAPDVRAKTERCLAACGPTQAAGCGFVGMNDNFGAMEVLILILAGEATDRPELVRNGVAKLRTLAGRLETHGAISEFNSPTYTGLTLACMADLYTYARDPEARALALRIEQQTWYDACARFHLGSSQMGGPSSRSYMADSCGHLHNGRTVFEVAFGGPEFFVSPLRYGYGQAAGAHLILHHGDPAFIAANGSWLAAPEFHPTDECGRMLLERQYPFAAVGTAACAAVWRPDDWRHYPDGTKSERFRKFEPFRFAPVLMTTWQTPDWCLGTSTGAHACGSGSQHDAFFLTWRRREPTAATPPMGIEDVRTAFCRYVFNGTEPTSEMGLLHDEGRKHAVQHGGTALVLYRPGIGVVRDITSMRLAIVFPLHCNAPDEVWLDDTALPDLTGASDTPRTVFLRDGLMYLAFRPLALTDYGRPQAVSVKRHEHFLTINLWNYQGPARSLNFPYQAALFTDNGFVVEAAAAHEVASFAEFRARVLTAELRDEVVQGIRQVSYRRPGLALEVHYDPADDFAIPPAWINGQPRDVPRWQATGIARLPWS